MFIGDKMMKRGAEELLSNPAKKPARDKFDKLYSMLEENLYSKSTSQSQLERISELVDTFLKESDLTSPSFLEKLNRKEKEALQAGRSSLFRFALQHLQMTNDFTKTRQLLDLFTQDTLATTSNCFPFEPPFSLMIQKVTEFKPETALQIFDYLSGERNISTEITVNGMPLIVYCVRYLGRPEWRSLVEKVIERNNPNTLAAGISALCVAANRGATFLMRKLLACGADFSIMTVEALNPGLKKPPLLLATENGHLECARLLLEAGASPDERSQLYLMPSVTDIPFSSWEWAVQNRREDFIQLFQEYAQRKKMRLGENVDPAVEGLRSSAALFLPSGLGTIGKRSQMARFKDSEHFSNALFEAFGVRCYIENPADRLAVESAIRWLMGEARESAAKSYWSPIVDRFLEECRSNPNFTIYVHHASTREDGCFNADAGCEIYLRGNQSEYEYKHTLAHEIGHWAIHKISGHRTPEGFMEAYHQDSEQFALPEIHPALVSLIQVVERIPEYNSELLKELLKGAEYSTRAWCQFPIKLALSDPTLDSASLDRIVEASMPRMAECFRQTFIDPPKVCVAVF